MKFGPVSCHLLGGAHHDALSNCFLSDPNTFIVAKYRLASIMEKSHRVANEMSVRWKNATLLNECHSFDKVDQLTKKTNGETVTQSSNNGSILCPLGVGQLCFGRWLFNPKYKTFIDVYTYINRFM